MAIHRNFKRVIILLFIYLLVASWILINYHSDTGLVYIAMGMISVLAYAIAESVGGKEAVSKLIGIDDDPIPDILYGLLISFGVITLMEISWITIGYPASIHPLTTFGEQMLIFSKFIVVAFLASVGEEIVFRGWARYAMWEGTDMYWIAVIVSSLAFSVFHYTAYGASLPAAYVGAFLIGIVLCLVSTWRKSLVPSIIIHSAINTYLLIQSEQLLVIGI